MNTEGSVSLSLRSHLRPQFRATLQIVWLQQTFWICFKFLLFFLPGSVGNKSYIPFDQILWQPAPETHPFLVLLSRGKVLTLLVLPHGNLFYRIYVWWLISREHFMILFDMCHETHMMIVLKKDNSARSCSLS